MSNSTNGLPQLESGQAQMEVIANKNFAAASPAMAYGIDSIIGDTLSYMEGNTLIAGVPTFVAAGTVTLSFSATNYVRRADATGVVSKVTSIPTDWPAPNGGYTPLYTVVMGASAYTSYSDWRTMGSGSTSAAPPRVIQVACSDQTTAITTGTAVVTFRMPYAMTLTAVRASLNTASSSGTPTIDINEGGTTILSTKLTIDASEKTSTTAAAAAVISDASLADDAEITIDIDVAGTGAKGLIVTLIGT